MIVFEISDESILFMIQFFVFAIPLAWIIVQITLTRDARKRRKEKE